MPKDRKRAANKEDGASAAVAKENTAIATATKMMTGTSSIVSNLNLNDPSNHEITDRLQHDTRGQQHMPDRIGKQRPYETRVHDQHGDDDGRGQTHQEHHRKPPLGGVNTHLTQNLETLANHVGEIVENLGQIAASLALQH